MKSQLGQLDAEAVLVLYAADELSVEDRRRVEAMLEGDPAMRAAAAQLAEAQGLVDEALARGDGGTRLPVDVRVAERRVGRMVREWAAVRPEREPTVVQKVVGLKYPWWTYPLTAAAAVALAFLVWWGNTPMRNTPYAGPVLPAEQGIVAPDEGEEVPEELQIAEELERSFSHPSQERIRAVEGEMWALSQAMAGGEDVEEPGQQRQEVNQ